jgi:hypothetical protein
MLILSLPRQTYSKWSLPFELSYIIILDALALSTTHATQHKTARLLMINFELIFLVYLTTLSVSQTIERQMIG